MLLIWDFASLYLLDINSLVTVIYCLFAVRDEGDLYKVFRFPKGFGLREQKILVLKKIHLDQSVRLLVESI